MGQKYKTKTLGHCFSSSSKADWHWHHLNVTVFGKQTHWGNCSHILTDDVHTGQSVCEPCLLSFRRKHLSQPSCKDSAFNVCPLRGSWPKPTQSPHQSHSSQRPCLALILTCGCWYFLQPHVCHYQYCHYQYCQRPSLKVKCYEVIHFLKMRTFSQVANATVYVVEATHWQTQCREFTHKGMWAAFGDLSLDYIIRLDYLKI